MRSNPLFLGFHHFFDGVAVDETGVIYVAKWLRGEVVRSTDEAVVASFTTPASLAFRGGTLFISSFLPGATAEGRLHALDLGVCGGAP